jgi:hypothetical protein
MTMHTACFQEEPLRGQLIYTPALIVQHCAVFGPLEQHVRAYAIDTPTPYAQYAVSIRLRFIEPRKRRVLAYILTPNNLRYATIAVQGQIIYDTRRDVPCDMAVWTAAQQEWQDRRPFQMGSRPLPA